LTQPNSFGIVVFEGKETMSNTALKSPSWEDLASIFPALETIASLEKSNELELRHYQTIACTTALFHNFRGVIRSATGSGKTLITAGICGMMLPRKSLILIHGSQLVRQTHEALCSYLTEDIVGLLNSSTTEPKEVTVASIDYLHYYLQPQMPNSSKGKTKERRETWLKKKAHLQEYLDTVDMLVIDECHHSSSDLFQDLGKWSNAYYRVGLSGTPLKKDLLSDMKLMSLVGPVIFDLNSKWLQEKGFLAQARLLIKTLDLTSPSSKMYDYARARKNILVENSSRITTIAKDIVEALKDKNNRILVLTGNSVDLAIKLGKEVSALFRRSKGRPTHLVVTGKTSAKKTNSSFEQLRTGRVKCVITTKLADEGIDVPDVNNLMLVGGSKAYVSTVQRIGRGLRKKEGGQELLVTDYFTLGNKYLEKHDKLRLKIYEEENFFTEIERV